MDEVPIIISIVVAAIGQFSILWWRIGKIEGRINGKINGSYFRCPFYKAGHNKKER